MKPRLHNLQRGLTTMALKTSIRYFAAALLAFAGCASDEAAGGAPDMPAGGDDQATQSPIDLSGLDVPSGGLVVTPGEVTLDLSAGGPVVSQRFTAVANMGSGPTDVTDLAAFSLDDAGLGAFAGPLFTSGTMRGGTTTVRASWNGLAGSAILHVKLHAKVLNSGCNGCPQFPAPDASVCADRITDPQLVYPPDGVLLPPNMNVIQVQFLPGKGNTLWEIAFENDATDIRVETRCKVITDSRGLETGGCAYDLNPLVWAYVAQSNRGADDITVRVRGWDEQATCASGSNERKVAFADEDLDAGLYYWQSVVIDNVQGKSGGIFRYDFGRQGQQGDVYLSPLQGSNTCIGCHYLSRDGLKMTYGFDDADADDEYGDLRASLLNVADKLASGARIPPGFQTFTHDHTYILATDGLNKNNPPAFSRFDGNTGKFIDKIPSGGKRATQPDWSFDDRKVVLVVPSTFFCNNGTVCAGGNDDHFGGGSLFTMGYDAGQKTFGAPAPLIASTGENNYYPAISPDGKSIAFNRVPTQKAPLDNDAFSNAAARVQFLALDQQGAKPVDGARLNLGDGLTNSWPRWSPFVHKYKGRHVAWITFSSMRDYGLRVRNSVKVPINNVPTDQRNCYPPESPENPPVFKQEALAPNCHQPQIWMAAIDLDAAGSGNGDPSWPAFWLPFQDPQAHNHIAQWVEKVVGQPVPDGGAGDMAGQCIPILVGCADGGTPCCEGLVCDQGVCSPPIM